MLTALEQSRELSQTLEERCARIGRAALASLHDELALEPKPGLVSFADNGSHSDMDARTFMRSLFALRHYFVRIAGAGAAHRPFKELEALGIEAEARMLRATGGVNTHRGAIFTLGLLCAAAAALPAAPDPQALRRSMRMHWGDALRERAARAGVEGRASHGSEAARVHGLRGAGMQAALGFPIVFECAVPALQRARHRGLDDRSARLDVLVHVIAQLDDTNLVYRGGMAGLRFAQAQARRFIEAGGSARPEAIEHARAIHASFMARRLSPGGAADVLAAACLVERLCR